MSVLLTSVQLKFKSESFFVLFLVHCYFCFTGVNTAISELKAGRNASSKLTILLTNADWGNLGKRYTGFILGKPNGCQQLNDINTFVTFMRSDTTFVTRVVCSVQIDSQLPPGGYNSVDHQFLQVIQMASTAKFLHQLQKLLFLACTCTCN